jgi:hypothetical protein
MGQEEENAQRRERMGHPPAAVDAIETAAAPVAPFAIGGATLLDVAVHVQCALDSSLPPQGIPIGPK